MGACRIKKQFLSIFNGPQVTKGNSTTKYKISKLTNFGPDNKTGVPFDVDPKLDDKNLLWVKIVPTGN